MEKSIFSDNNSTFLTTVFGVYCFRCSWKLKIIPIIYREIAVQSLALTFLLRSILHVHDKVKTWFLEHISFAIHAHNFIRIRSVLGCTEWKIKIGIEI